MIQETLKNETKARAKTRSVGDYLLDALKETGVDHIFGIPGDYVIRFDKRIEEYPGIKFINATRENTAGFMADAYARLRGVGVACITYGVGINILNSVAQCFVESSPVIFISGAPGLDEKEHFLHHLIHGSSKEGRDFTQVNLFKQITCDQAILNDPKTAAKEIKRVINACLTNKKPVYIELPRNVVDQVIEEEPFSITKKTSANEDSKELLEAAKKLLKTTKIPIIWAGHEISRLGLEADLLAFAEKFNIPIFTSLLGKGLIDENHPLFSGVYQGELSKKSVSDAFGKADIVIVLGVMPTDVDTGLFTAKLKKGKHIIANESHIAIGEKNYPNISLSSFLKELSKADIQNTFTESKLVLTPRNPFEPSEAKLTTDRLMEALNEYLSEKNILVVDIGDAFFASKDLPVGKKGYLASAYFATMGFAVPGAIGAQIANKSKRAVVLVGDGAFQMTGTELTTAIRYHLDPIVIVLNNHGYGTERPILEGKYNDIQNWNYSKMTELLGSGIGLKVTTEKELKEALQKAFTTKGKLFIIEAELPKKEFSAALKKLGTLAAK